MNIVVFRRISLSVILMGSLLIQTSVHAIHPVDSSDHGKEESLFVTPSLKDIAERYLRETVKVLYEGGGTDDELSSASGTSDTSSSLTPSIFPETVPPELKFFILSFLEPKDLQQLSMVNKKSSLESKNFLLSLADSPARAFKFFEQNKSTWQLSRLYQYMGQLIQNQVWNYLQTWPDNPQFIDQVRLVEEKTFEHKKDRRNQRFIENRRAALVKQFNRAEIPIDTIMETLSTFSETDLITLQKNPDSKPFRQKLTKKITEFYNMPYNHDVTKKALKSHVPKAFQYVDCLLKLCPNDEKTEKSDYIASGINLGYKVLAAQEHELLEAEKSKLDQKLILDKLKNTYSLIASYFDQLIHLSIESKQINQAWVLRFYEKAIKFFQDRAKDKASHDLYYDKKSSIAPLT